MIYLRYCVPIIVLLLAFPLGSQAQDVDSSEKLSPRMGGLLLAPMIPLPTDIDKLTVNAYRPKPSTNTLADLANLHSMLSPSVLKLFVLETLPDKKRKMIGTGSAVAVDARTLLTNCHIVAKNEYLVVARDVRGKNHLVQLHGQDRGTDRCIYKARGDVFAPVKTFRHRDSLMVGERVFSIGHPKGFESVITEGLLAGKKSKADRQILLTSANIAKGSSGGALFDYAGHLIGITMGIVNDAEYLGIVIPVSDFLPSP